MGKKTKLLLFSIAFLAVAISTTLYLSHIDIAVLNPKGWVATEEKHLFIIITALMLIIVIPTLLLIFFFAWRYREGNPKARYSPDREQHPAAEIVWWGFPFLIVLAMAVLVWQNCHKLDPFKPLISNVKPLKIQVVALQWKWLFIYPEQNIATVNFFQFPEKTPLNFEITADAPMNSFWIPQLGGQIYAMPGMKAKLHLIANEPGEFRGCSANLSGKGFSGMTFIAKASSENDFDAWVESIRLGQSSLDFDAYKKLAEPSENNPVAYYQLSDGDLYEHIMMKYMGGM